MNKKYILQHLLSAFKKCKFCIDTYKRHTPQKFEVYHRKKCTSFFLPDINFTTLVLMKNNVFEIFYRGMFHPFEIQAKFG